MKEVSLFKLPTELTIAQVDDCKSQFMQYVESNQTEDLTIDDSDVSRIDTIGVQFLLAVVIYVASQNKSLHWQCQSSIIKQSITQLGVNETILNQYISA